MPYSLLFDFSEVKNIWAKVALCGVQNAGVSKPNLRPPVAGRRRSHLGLHKGEELMPYSSLFDFLRVQNIWVKVTLGRVKNTRVSKRKLHPPISGLY